jgi:hypothetical protein
VREINPQTHLLGANSGISFQENCLFICQENERKRERKREFVIANKDKLLNIAQQLGLSR